MNEHTNYSLDQRKLRNAYGLFATGVALVSCFDNEGKAIGLTINSFASVSLEPAMIAWSLARKSNRFQVFFQAKTFTISFLAQTHQELAKNLSQKGHKGTLHEKDIQHHPTFPPSVDGALGGLHCRTKTRIESENVGDHVLILAECEKIIKTSNENKPPLLFFRGSFGTML